MSETTYAVLFTYYNEGELFTRTLESLRSQSHVPSEIWIYDDCSEIRPEAFVPAGMMVRILRGEINVGPSKGRNRLLAETNADFVHFHDADDLFAPRWSDFVVEKISQPGMDMVFTEIQAPGHVGGFIGFREFRDQKEWVEFCLKCAILTSAGTYRTRKVRALGGYREDLWQSEDFEFHLRLASAGLRFAVVAEPLVYRLRGAGRSEKQDEVWLCALQALEILAPKLAVEHPQALSDAFARVASRLFRMGLRIDARRGFAQALRYGMPRLEARGPSFHWIARLAGFENAERVSSFYRSLVPTSLRRRVQKRAKAA